MSSSFSFICCNFAILDSTERGKPGPTRQTAVHHHPATVVTSAPASVSVQLQHPISRHGPGFAAALHSLARTNTETGPAFSEGLSILSPVKVTTSTAFRPVSSLAHVSHVPVPSLSLSHVSHVGLPGHISGPVLSLPALPPGVSLPPVPPLLSSYHPRPGILPMSHAPSVPNILNPFR